MNRKWTLGVLSRFVEKKNISMIIEVVYMLKKRGVDVSLEIGGGGELEGALIEQTSRLGLEKYVKFLGWVKDKKSFFDSIDIFCLPSLEEPFGIVILEAFKHKVPVVSTNIGGPSKIIQHNKTGVLSSVKAKDFQEKIFELIQDEELRDYLIKNGYQDYLDKYSIGSAAKKIEETLLKAIG